MLNRVCAHCGSQYSKRTNTRFPKRFCSRACYLAYKRNLPGDTRVCPICHKHFKPTGTRKITCSRPCQRKFQIMCATKSDCYYAITPPSPTTALPGTTEKIQVMANRVSKGFSPFHPLDPTLESTPTPE